MKKSEQLAINNKVVEAMENARAEANKLYLVVGKQLRTCSAKVYKQGGYTFLKSYNTTIAMIDNSTGIGYDFLRKVYGYTATSAKHVSKFMYDYSASKVLTYKEV